MEIVLTAGTKEKIVARLLDLGNPSYDTRDGEYHTDGGLIWWRDAEEGDHPPGDQSSGAEEAVPISDCIPAWIDLSWPNEDAATIEEQTALLRAEMYDEIGGW